MIKTYVDREYTLTWNQKHKNRVLNNRQLDLDILPWTTSLNPVFSFFNHSCDLNIGCPIGKTSTVGFALKDIKKGEEFFTSYAAHVRMAREERQRKLKP